MTGGAPAVADVIPAGSPPVLSILRRLPRPTAGEVARAIAEAGVAAVEVTVDSPQAFELVADLRSALPSLRVGVGTVLEAASVGRAADAGAHFVVSPHVDEQIAQACAAHGLAVVPGAATATEALRAHRLGAAIVKLFPAAALGVATFAALREPLPFIPLMAVGGVSADNALDFFRAGAVAVGIGGWLSAGGDAREASARARTLLRSLEAADVRRA